MKKSDLYPPELITAFESREVILFVGAGLSLGAGLPSWYDLIEKLANRIEAKIPPPEWTTGELLIDIAQDYVNQRDLINLVLFLQEELSTTGKKLSSAHEALPNLPVSLIFTANFDDFLERTYQNVHRQTRIIERDTQIPFMRSSPNIVNIVKLYGDLNQPETIVLAREQYEQFFLVRPQMMKLLETVMANSVMLYLGWSHSDPYFNMIFGELLHRFGKFARSGYAVMFDLTDEKRRELERKKIKVIELPSEGGRTEQLTNWLKTISSSISDNSAISNPAFIPDPQTDLSLTEWLETIRFEVQQQGELTRQSIKKTQESILTHYDKKHDLMIAQVVSELSQLQASAVYEVVAALDSYQGNDETLQSHLYEIQELLNNVKGQLDELDNATLLEAANEILATISEPQVGIRHKLKLTIPLLGPFIGYEGELDLNQEVGLEGVWQSLRNKLGFI